MLANFAFLSQKDNRTIQDKAPSDYVKMMPPGSVEAIFASSMIPPGALAKNYDDFVAERAMLLAAEANKLLA